MEKYTSKPVVLITAGPTREAIDPVRFISNHSSGKMGYAIAECFLNEGYQVILVSGPVDLKLSHAHLNIIHVNSADEMYSACKRFFEQVNIAVFAAAVADYKPEVIHHEKLKKSSAKFALHMVKNVDIASEFGKQKKATQIAVGFALETINEEAHALKKLRSKNLDLVVLNSLRDKGAAFGFDTNKISILASTGEIQKFPLKHKKDVASDIVARIISLTSQHYSTHNYDHLQII
jgi:phosphopantothenoylcysteine decarboxylase/phosphopantothenate--cysteine ligase